MSKYCGHCKNLGKPESEYRTHYPRKTESRNSELTCPELLKNQKPMVREAPKQTKQPMQTKQTKQTNRYGLLEEEEEENQFNPELIANMTEEEQILYVGNELYEKVAITEPELAGKITGMLFQLDMTELVEMAQNPDALAIRVVEAKGIL
jgi:polyadenylate-binding protein